jgi:NADPH:quinone reductase
LHTGAVRIEFDRHCAHLGRDIAALCCYGRIRGSSLGASEVFDYHADDWVQQVLAVVPGGVDVLFDAAGGQTRDRAVGAVREDGRAIFLVGAPAHLGRGVKGESLDADVNRQVLEAVGRLVEAGKLRPQVEAVLPFEQVRGALERVAGRHTRGMIVLQIGS